MEFVIGAKTQILNNLFFIIASNLLPFNNDFQMILKT